MTTLGTMNGLLDRLRDKIEDADEYVKRSEAQQPYVEDQNYVVGYDVGYAEALRELWFDITGDEYSAQQTVI